MFVITYKYAVKIIQGSYEDAIKEVCFNIQQIYWKNNLPLISDNFNKKESRK